MAKANPTWMSFAFTTNTKDKNQPFPFPLASSRYFQA